MGVVWCTIGRRGGLDITGGVRIAIFHVELFRGWYPLFFPGWCV